MGENEAVAAGKPFNDEDKIHLFLAYFGILALIPFFMFKDKRSDPQKEYVYWHARQGLALAITVCILCVVMVFGQIILAFIPVIGWILSCLLWVCVMVVAWGGSIMGWIKAFGGVKWEMPGVSKIAAMFN